MGPTFSKRLLDVGGMGIPPTSFCIWGCTCRSAALSAHAGAVIQVRAFWTHDWPADRLLAVLEFFLQQIICAGRGKYSARRGLR